MQLENKTKERIKEKFYNKSIFNHAQNNEILNNIYNNGVNMTSERITGGKRENKVSNNHTISEVSHDDIYNDERHDYDDDLNLPVDDEMSIFLPDLNAMTGYNYKTQDIDYEMKLNLLKGYPREKTPIKFIFFTVNTKGVLPFLLFLFYKQVNHGGKGIKGNETFIIFVLKS